MNEAHTTNSRTVIAAIWIFAIVIGVGLTLMQRHDDQVQQALLLEYRARQQALSAQDGELLRRVVQFYHERRNVDGMMPHRADAMELLAQSGSPAPATSMVDQPILTDPQTGARVRLNLFGDRWLAYALLPRMASPPRMPIAVTVLRWAMLGFMMVGWVLIMFLRPASRGQRQVWAHLLTAVAALVMVIVALEPAQSIRGGSSRITGAGTVFWIAAMTISIVSLVFAYRKPRADHPICRNCGYNLTGNTSGVCPECGTPAASAPSSRAQGA